MLLVSDVQDTILILRRSVQMPKHLWRQPSTCRTLLPILLDPIVGQALQCRTSHHPTGYGVVEAELSIDGDHLEKRTERTGRVKKDWSGVFNVTTVGCQVKLSLSQEACHREVYTPRRSTQYLATLKPWEPTRPSQRQGGLVLRSLLLSTGLPRPLVPRRATVAIVSNEDL